MHESSRGALFSQPWCIIMVWVSQPAHVLLLNSWGCLPFVLILWRPFPICSIRKEVSQRLIFCLYFYLGVQEISTQRHWLGLGSDSCLEVGPWIDVATVVDSPTIRAIWLTHLLNRCRRIKAGIPQADLPLKRNELHHPYQYTGHKSLTCGQPCISHQGGKMYYIELCNQIKISQSPWYCSALPEPIFVLSSIPTYLFQWVQFPKFKIIYETREWCKGMPLSSMKVSEDSWR